MSIARTTLTILPLFLLSYDSSMQDSLGPIGMRSLTSLSALLVVAWSTMRGAHAITQAEIEQHLEMGKKLLAAGQLSDALTHYHAAVEGDPKNYISLFRRATVFLAMGKSKSAVPDLDQVLVLKPDFTAARLRRGDVKLKQGRLDEAQKDFQDALKFEPGSQEAKSHVDMIGPLKTDMAYAKELYFANEYREALEHLNKIIDTCPWDAQLHEMRADIYEKIGEYYKAMTDIRITTKLVSDNTDGFLRLSLMYYQVGDAEQSLQEIRECLKLDQDHKKCKDHYKKVKKLNKQINEAQDNQNKGAWEDCVERANAMLKTEAQNYHFVMRARGHLCTCYVKAQNVDEGMKQCNTILKDDENNVDALCNRAEVHILNENYEQAINDYRKATDVDEGSRKAQDGLKKAQKLLKQSQKRDYYKILGVKRNAKKKEILKAYRKLAAEWHPDKFQDEQEKIKAESMFRDIAAAKEVLTDPEKREQFDQGSDPLDPEEQAHQQGGGFNPFAQGFNPFGQGGGFNFKFHFN